MRDFCARALPFALVALVAQIPFELRQSLLGLSNLQWTFVLTVLLAAPTLLEHRAVLLRDTLVRAAMIFIATQWLAAVLAPEFRDNAFKAAARFSAGLLLLAVVRVYRDRASLWRAWSVVAGLAALYALSAYLGYGPSSPFRSEEFFAGTVQRLSGSFEYPNTAAGYFALSLPIVWWSTLRGLWKWPAVALLWVALTLTISRGAMIAVLAAGLLAAVTLWKKKNRAWKSHAGFVVTGIAFYAAVLPAIPYLSEHVVGLGLGNPKAAVYKTPWNSLRQHPNTRDQVPLQIRNTDATGWPTQGASRVAVSYRWWNIGTETFLQDDRQPLISALPHDVSPGETVEVPVAIETPEKPGNYILVLELFSRDFYWFSRTGLVPALVLADIDSEVLRQTSQADLSIYYNWEQTNATRRGTLLGESLTASVPRSSLWRAALGMFVKHPFGTGPDNFRLLYGSYLGAENWNTRIHSNNLYLELLAGSGWLGLTAFVLMIWTRPWKVDAWFVAIAVFLIHGFVDVFLMATPIYFTFWMLLSGNPAHKAQH